MFSRRLFLSIILVAIPASADLLQVAVSGTFDGSTTGTALTAPGASWAITFDLDTQPTLSPWVADTFLALISNLEFKLNGVAVSGAGVNAGVVFNDVAAGGDFSIGILDAASPDDELNFLFSGTEQVFSGNLDAPEILIGTYDIGATALFVDSESTSSPATSSIVITDLSPVPEPRADLLLGNGVGSDLIPDQAASAASGASREVARVTAQAGRYFQTRADPQEKNQNRRLARRKLQVSLRRKRNVSRRLFLSLILVAMPASADLLQVAISGTFDGSVPVTDLTSESASWVLTFDVDSQVTAAGHAIGSAVSNLTYVLNNNPVSGVAFNGSPIFRDTADGGGIGAAILNSDGSTSLSFNFVESQQLFSGVSNPEIQPGAYDSALTDDLEIGVSGSVEDDQTASILITDLSAVPEPHSNLLLGTVFVMAGSAFLFKRRRGSAAPRERSQD